VIPDLDREYLLGNRDTFKEEQWHRSLFHNLLFFSGVKILGKKFFGKCYKRPKET
jgi:hypothetical protein